MYRCMYAGGSYALTLECVYDSLIDIVEINLFLSYLILFIVICRI